MFCFRTIVAIKIIIMSFFLAVYFLFFFQSNHHFEGEIHPIEITILTLLPTVMKTIASLLKSTNKSYENLSVLYKVIYSLCFILGYIMIFIPAYNYDSDPSNKSQFIQMHFWINTVFIGIFTFALDKLYNKEN